MKMLLIPVLSACFALATPVVAQGDVERSTLEIASGATARTMPNTLTLSFAIETDAPLAKEAVNENAERTRNVLTALKRVGDKDTKVWTSGFALSPLYEKGDPARPSGFRARNAVVLESKLMDKAGAFIDEAAEAGVSRISNLSFTSDKEEALRREAAVAALKKAKDDAEMLAEAAGMAVKGIVKIVYDQREHTPVPILRDAALGGVQTPVAVGEISVHANVKVVFELE